MELRTFPVPVAARYFEHYEIDATYEFGPAAVDESEIISFGRRFDPQPMHTDPRSAQAQIHGGVIASGWHTIGIIMRLLVDNYLSSVASFASPGVDEVRWLKPVRPDDMLRLRVSVLDRRQSRSKPDRGLVTSLVEGLNQHDDIVVSLKAINLIGVRPFATEPRNQPS